MTDEQIKELVVKHLTQIAPDIEIGQIDFGVDLREQVDFDSMDILNFAVALHEATGVEIPEADYPLMVTLDGCIAYLRERLKT